MPPKPSSPRAPRMEKNDSCAPPSLWGRKPFEGAFPPPQRLPFPTPLLSSPQPFSSLRPHPLFFSFIRLFRVEAKVWLHHHPILSITYTTREFSAKSKEKRKEGKKLGDTRSTPQGRPVVLFFGEIRCQHATLENHVEGWEASPR